MFGLGKGNKAHDSEVAASQQQVWTQMKVSLGIEVLYMKLFYKQFVDLLLSILKTSLTLI